MGTPKVGYKVMSHARWELPLELTTEVPDTSNPDFPGGGPVRPNSVGVGITLNHETGLWEVWNASVVGPKVKDGKVSTKRDYAIPFATPLDGEGGSEVAPQWLKDLCQEWVDRANGISTNSPARGEAEVDEDTARPGAVLPREEGVAMKYDLGTCIEFAWDDAVGEIVVSTPKVFEPVVRARKDGNLGVRLVHVRESY